MRWPMRDGTGRLIGILGQQHVKSWFDPPALHLGFICLPLANFWTLGLNVFDMSVFLHLWLPPECRIFDGDSDYLLATWLFVKHNLPPQDIVTLLALPGLTYDNIGLVSRFRHLW